MKRVSGPGGGLPRQPGPGHGHGHGGSQAELGGPGPLPLPPLPPGCAPARCGPLPSGLLCPAAARQLPGKNPTASTHTPLTYHLCPY